MLLFQEVFHICTCSGLRDHFVDQGVREKLPAHVAANGRIL